MVENPDHRVGRGSDAEWISQSAMRNGEPEATRPTFLADLFRPRGSRSIMQTSRRETEDAASASY